MQSSGCRGWGTEIKRTCQYFLLLLVPAAKPLKPPKPAVPVKPDKLSRDSVSPSSPPTSRKKASSHSLSPSPPPLPPGEAIPTQLATKHYHGNLTPLAANASRKMLSEQKCKSAPEVSSHVQGSSNTLVNEYGQLNEVSTELIGK